MPNINTILCPVDFSDHSRHALAHAARLSQWFRAKLVVLHVYPQPLPPPPVLFGGLPGPLPMPNPPPLTSSPERTQEETLTHLSSFVSSTLSRSISPTLEVHPGTPAGTILESARRAAADLLVLGTHGHGGVERWLLGSVTEKVLRKATCPVLTVPPAVGDPAEDALSLFRRILCAIDFSDASLKGLEYALALAKETQAEVMLVHVIEGVPEAPEWRQPPGPVVTEYLRLSEDHARTRLQTILPEDAHRWCRPETMTPSGKPYREILRLAQETDAHLIVMGAHGRGQIDRLFFGSTTNQVIRAAACPVLTLRG